MKNRITNPSSSRGRLLTCALIGGIALITLVIIAGAVAYFYFYGSIPIFTASAPSNPPAPGPAVTIQEPLNGAQFTQGDSFIFFASANDGAGVIRLDLWVDDVLVLSQSSPDATGLPTLSLSYPMVATRAGNYILYARAFNSAGEMGESVVHYVTVVEQVASTQEYAQYVVQEGDTLENIAARLGVSVDDILAANPQISGGQVFPGQVIIIPMPKGQPPQVAVPGPNGVQPIVFPGGGQPGPGPQGPAPNPPNPPPPGNQPSLTIKGISVATSPVFYGQSCTTEPLTTNVTVTVDPPNAVKTATLKYAYYGKAGSSPVLSLPMVSIGGSDFGANINAGGESAQYLAQDGGAAVVWVEVTDANAGISISQSSTLIVNFCLTPPNPPPPPGNQPSLTIKGISIATSPVFYGQSCTTEPLTTNVTVTVDPPNAVKTATLKYAYYGKAGSSPVLSLPMVPIGGSDFGTNINAGGEAAQYLAQDGGAAVVWVEVTDANARTSISQSSTLIVNFCPNPAPPPNLGNLPGILPQFMPGAIPMQNPEVAQIEPNLFPAPGVVLGPDVGRVMDPSNLKAVSADGCKITLTWTDNASDETSYEIHRLDPGQLHYALVTQLKPNITQYEDRTPSPGRYMYYVVALRTINGVTSSGGSYNTMVDVTLTTNCALTSGPKRLIFQPINFHPNDSGISKAFVSITLNGFSPIRVPRTEQDYLPIGDWSAAGEWAIPLPETILAKPGDYLTVEVWGGGYTPTGPANLRGFQRSHTYESLADPGARTTNWSGNDRDAQFDLIYRLWLDNWQWGGAVSDPSIPPPTNLKLDSTDLFGHKLTWDYDSKAKPTIDGFIVYGKYSCPGGIQDPHYVVTKNPGGNSTADQKLTIQTHKQPTGCVCQYQVSAFSAGGESKLSAPTSEKCETGAPQANIIVTFNTFKMTQDAPRPGDINLFAGDFRRSSATMVLEGGREYNLQDLYFDGTRNNNRIIVPVTAGTNASVVEYTITPSAIISAGICQLNPIAIKFPTAAALYGESRLFQLRGSCGSNCTCEINGKVEAVPTGGGAPGAVPPKGDWKNIGEACAADSECISSYCQNNICTPSLKGLNGAVCFANNQCTSGVCRCYFTNRSDFPDLACPGIPIPDVSGVCVGPSETDVANGGKCSSSYVCASGYCANGLCAPKDGFGRVGDYCHHDNHCANQYCVCPFGYDGDFCKGYRWFTDKPGQHGTCGEWQGAESGATCMADNDCESRHCAENKCAPINGTGLLGDYCHHDDHCSSGHCICLGGFTMGIDFFSIPACTGYENYTPEQHGTCSP